MILGGQFHYLSATSLSVCVCVCVCVCEVTRLFSRGQGNYTTIMQAEVGGKIRVYCMILMPLMEYSSRVT